MSIRIDSDKLQGAASLQTGQADQVRSTGDRFSLKSGTSAAGRDTVEISSMAGSIADASAAHSAQSADRVKQLSALYASGRYQVDSLQLSKALVSNAISSGSGIES